MGLTGANGLTGAIGLTGADGLTLAIAGDLNVNSTSITLDTIPYTSPAITKDGSTYTIDSSMLINGSITIGTGSDTPTVIINGNLIIAGSFTHNADAILQINGDIISNINTSANTDLATIDGTIIATGAISLSNFGHGVFIDGASMQANTINMVNNIGYVDTAGVYMTNAIIITDTLSMKDNAGSGSNDGIIINSNVLIYTDYLKIRTNASNQICTNSGTITFATNIGSSPTNNPLSHPHIVLISNPGSCANTGLPASGIYI